MTTDMHSRLRGAGLKVTPGRVAVLDALAEVPHVDADRVRRHIAGILPAISVQSVHNVLGDLVTAGLIRRIEPAGSAALYELRVDDNHHHVVCTACGAVADVDCVHGAAPCLTPGDAGGFAIATAEITFWGLCPGCQAANDFTDPTHQTKETRQ